MGFLPFFVLGIASIMYVISDFYFLRSTLESKNRVDLFLKVETSLELEEVFFPERAKIEEIEAAMIRYCQLGQAMIIKCQECYMAGNTYCPFPTDSFCQSVRGASYNIPDIVWGFLPDNTGSLTDIFDAPQKDINTLTNVTQLPEGIRWLISKQFSPSYLEGFTYIKPSGSSSDICAVEGVVSK